MRSSRLLLFSFVLLGPVWAAVPQPASRGANGTAPGSATIIWRFEDLQGGGRPATTVLGAPRAVVEAGQKALRFNGESDGLIMAQNPIQGWRAFTIEVLFNPDSNAPAAQRFVHLEDSKLNRALIETRVTGEHWYLDTFLFSSRTEKGVTLVDKEKLHPCNRWFWAALTYDGKVMSHFVNGTQEKEGTIDFEPMTDGRTSAGVRLNQVFWFKGCIAEIRFHPRALRTTELQRIAGGIPPRRTSP